MRIFWKSASGFLLVSSSQRGIPDAFFLLCYLTTSQQAYYPGQTRSPFPKQEAEFLLCWAIARATREQKAHRRSRQTRCAMRRRSSPKRSSATAPLPVAWKVRCVPAGGVTQVSASLDCCGAGCSAPARTRSPRPPTRRRVRTQQRPPEGEAQPDYQD